MLRFTHNSWSRLRNVLWQYLFYFIPLPFSRDCSPASGPMTWLMFATPVRGLELSEIWGLFIQICKILSQQWNCIFSPLDVAIFLFPSCFQTSSEHYILGEKFFFVSRLKIPILRREYNLGPLILQSDVFPLCQPAMAFVVVILIRLEPPA